MTEEEENLKRKFEHKIVLCSFMSKAKDMAVRHGVPFDESRGLLIISVDKSSVSKDLFAVASIEDCGFYVEADVRWMVGDIMIGEPYLDVVNKTSCNRILREIEEILFVDEVPPEIKQSVEEHTWEE